MDQLNKFLTDLLTKPRYEEDFVDRLNYRVTGVLLLMFSVTISLKEYCGKPIQCWVPAQFTGGWEQYVEDYCFVENTYWLPMEQEIPTDYAERDRRMLNYYQWVPFVLAIQALMFNLPNIIWRSLNWIAGLNVRAIVGMACNPGELAGKTVDDTVGLIAQHIKDGVRIQTNISRSSNPFAWILRWGCTAKSVFVTSTYLFVKLLFVGNLVAQFFILNSFLRTSYRYWGAEILSDLSKGHEWEQTGHFPRVTLCDFKVRQLGNLHNWSVQCVLMLNMFTEKIYLFVWWWFVLVFFITVFSFFHWLFANLVPALKKEFVVRMLSAQNLPNREKGFDEPIDMFIHDRLKTDGVFVLRLMTKNAGDIIGSQVVAKMYHQYCEEQQEKQKKKQPVTLFETNNMDEKKTPPPTYV